MDLEFSLCFPIYLIWAIWCSRHKRLWPGDFVDIRMKDLPILFVLGVVVLYLFAFDGFCNIVALFERFPSIQPFVLSKEKLKLLDVFSMSLCCLELSAVSVLARKFTIKKKNYTWKETPLIRSFFVMFCLLLCVFYAESSVKKIVSVFYM